MSLPTPYGVGATPRSPMASANQPMLTQSLILVGSRLGKIGFR
jgi:hypothetical protein